MVLAALLAPDWPGFFSAVDSGIDEAIDNAKQAIELWIETALDDNQDVPTPSSINALLKKKEFKGMIWASAEIDSAHLSNAIKRVNISLPKRVPIRLDAKAKSTGENHSGFIAQMANSA